MLQVKNLYKEYQLKNKKIEVNKNINFCVHDGSIIWIKGNSGAGKSTLLNLLSGIDVPTSGEIVFREKIISQMRKNESSDFRIQNCGLVFQFFELLKTQSAYNNAILPLKIAKKTPKEIKERISELFTEFGILELAEKKPQELSGGERQRVAICRALANEPDLFLADEITASLDVNLSHKVYKYLQKYIKQNNRIGVFVSHDEIIKNYVDEVYEMNQGELKKCLS